MAGRTDWLTEKAQILARDLAMRTGSLKVVLSAGVVALSKLSAEEREQIILEAQGGKSEAILLNSMRIRATLRELVEKETTAPGSIIKLLNHDEQAMMTELRRLLEPPKTKLKSKGA